MKKKKDKLHVGCYGKLKKDKAKHERHASRMRMRKSSGKRGHPTKKKKAQRCRLPVERGEGRVDVGAR